MSRPTIRQLQAEIYHWANRIPVGSEWRHYRGDVYEVTGFGVNEMTDKVEVQYRAAIIGEPMPHLYVVGGISCINPDVVFHKEAELWEQDVEVKASDLLPPEVIETMTAEEKLGLANASDVTRPRFIQVARVEHFVEVNRRA